MASPNTLPSLFGRVTAILQDHENLGSTLKRLRVMCAELDAREAVAGPVNPAQLLEMLHKDLSEHFVAEEAEAYFGTIADEAPALATRIDNLKHEHTTMLTSIFAIRRVADDPTRGTDLSRAIRELIGQLERHEREESLLLREFFAPRQ